MVESWSSSCCFCASSTVALHLPCSPFSFVIIFFGPNATWKESVALFCSVLAGGAQKTCRSRFELYKWLHILSMYAHNFININLVTLFFFWKRLKFKLCNEEHKLWIWGCVVPWIISSYCVTHFQLELLTRRSGFFTMDRSKMKYMYT